MSDTTAASNNLAPCTTLVRLLGSPSCHEYSKSSSPEVPIPEPTRSRILALCGHFLAGNGMLSSLHFLPWTSLGTLHCTFVFLSTQPFAGPSPVNLEHPNFDAFRFFNQVYRTALVMGAFTGSLTKKEGRKEVTRAMWEAKTEETCQALLNTALPRMQAHYLASCTRGSQTAGFAAAQRAMREGGQ
ncbi:hypothetical protein JCM10213_008468 [Rhodosporidiobolus nylandii]